MLGHLLIRVSVEAFGLRFLLLVTFVGISSLNLLPLKSLVHGVLRRGL